MSIGYCTPDDVRAALKEQDLQGQITEPDVTPAILGQTEWLQETTHRHWYTTTSNPTDPLPTAPLTHDEDVLSLPASPHPAPSQRFHRADVGTIRYPRPVQGRYTAVDLRRRDVRSITELLVLDETGEPTDWVAEKTEGRGEDYYLQVDDSDGISTLYLDTRSLPPRSTFGEGVIATYDWGIDGISETVRRAVALRAGAQLVLDDDTQIGIPDSGQLVSLESKAQAMERQAEELLDIHMLSHPVA